jgi:hypothetical protein
VWSLRYKTKRTSPAMRAAKRTHRKMRSSLRVGGVQCLLLVLQIGKPRLLDLCYLILLGCLWLEKVNI